jgi:hypothetical protein
LNQLEKVRINMADQTEVMETRPGHLRGRGGQGSEYRYNPIN